MKYLSMQKYVITVFYNAEKRYRKPAFPKDFQDWEKSGHALYLLERERLQEFGAFGLRKMSFTTGIFYCST